jgi:hypothetical protein
MTTKLKFAHGKGRSEPSYVGCYESFRMSANPLSPAAQATLLLCSPLRAGRNKDVPPLSIGEFNELEKQLQRAGAGFNVGNAMQRNKQIYALADFGLVVSSGFNEGGTWAGAVEQLEKLHLAPLFVREAGEVPTGNRELLRRGGLKWPSVRESDSLRAALTALATQTGPPLETGGLFAPSALHEAPRHYRGSRPEAPTATKRKKKNVP